MAVTARRATSPDLPATLTLGSSRDSRSAGANSLFVSVLVGLFVLGLVAGAGVTYILTRPAEWSATASFAVFPSTSIAAQNEASYYETLSRGQIVTTMAQVVTAQQRSAGTDVVVQVVPETSLVTLTAKAGSQQVAEVTVQRQLRAALVALESLKLPFDARVVDAGPGTGEPAEADTVASLGIVALVALVLALAAQQAVALLPRARRRDG